MVYSVEYSVAISLALLVGFPVDGVAVVGAAGFLIALSKLLSGLALLAICAMAAYC